MTTSIRRIVVSVALMAVAAIVVWLWWHTFEVSSGDVNTMLADLQWRWLPPIFLLLAVHIGLSAIRWAEIERALGGERPGLGIAFASGAFALGLGTVLPAPIMNVACRSLANRVSGQSMGRGAISGTIDQLSDFLVSGWLAIPATLALLNSDVRLYFLTAPPVVLIGFVALLGLRWLEPPVKRFWPFAQKKWTSLLLSRKTLFRIYGLSLLRLGNLTLISVLVQLAANTASSGAVAVSVPVVTIVTALAMLPGSLGVVEWSYSFFLTAFGISSGDIVTFVLANRLILTILPVALAVTVALVSLLQNKRAKPVG